MHRGINIATVTVAAASAVIVLAAIGLIIAPFVINGASHALTLSFLTEGTSEGGRTGGVLPIAVSTILLVLVALAVAIPSGLLTAIFISEYSSKYPRLSRVACFSLDIFAGIPSIVFGFLGYSLFCLYLGMGFSILAGALTLACMIVPLIVRNTLIGLQSIPVEWRLGAAAVCMSRQSFMRHVALPWAAPAIASGIVLATGRALGETAALIYTSGFVDRLPESLSDSGRSLSVHIFELAMNVPGSERNASASAALLMALVITLNVVTVAISNRYASGRKS